jgi:hypothetical protein
MFAAKGIIGTQSTIITQITIREEIPADDFLVLKLLPHHLLYHTWKLKGSACQIGNRAAPERGKTNNKVIELSFCDSLAPALFMSGK